MNIGPLGKILLITGAAVMILGAALLFFDRIPFLGKLPGDFMIRRKGFTFYFPLGTSILISIIMSAILYALSYFKR